MYSPDTLIKIFSALKAERYYLDRKIRDIGPFLGGGYYGNIISLTDNIAKNYSALSSTLLKSYLWSNGSQSFRLIYDKKDMQIQTFYEGITSCIQSILDTHNTGFDLSLSKAIHDWNDYGLGYMTVSEDEDTGVRFSTSDITKTYLDLDYKERPIFYYIQHYMTVTQVLSRWGPNPKYGQRLQTYIENDEITERVEFLQVIKPRENNLKKFKQTINLSNQESNKNSPFISLWIEREDNEIIEEEGFWELPIYAIRHKTRTAQKYGEGVGIDLLEPILQLQELWRNVNYSIDLTNEIPIWLRNSSILGADFLDRRPNSVTIFNQEVGDSSNPIGVIPTSAPQALNAYLPLINDRRQSILQGYMIDRLLQLDTVGNVTATEILEIKATRVSLFTSHRDEVYTDLLTPIFKRTFNILWRRGIIQKYLQDKNIMIPIELKNNTDKLINFRISFDTNATTDMKVQKASNLGSGLNQLGQLMSLAPNDAQNILQNFNLDGMAREIATIYNFNENLLNNPILVNEIRQVQRANEQAAQQQANALQLLQQAA